MDSLSILIGQVRVVLIQTEDKNPRHEIYNQFIKESKASNLTEDDFYKKVLKAAHKSIDRDCVEGEKKRKDETLKRLVREFTRKENLIQSIPIDLDRLIKMVFEDGVVESDKLVRALINSNS